MLYEFGDWCLGQVLKDGHRAFVVGLVCWLSWLAYGSVEACGDLFMAAFALLGLAVMGVGIHMVCMFLGWGVAQTVCSVSDWYWDWQARKAYEASGLD